MKLFQPVSIFLKLSTNEMEITRLDTMKSIHRVSKTPFSNSRITLADFHVANTFLNEILNELFFSKLTDSWQYFFYYKIPYATIYFKNLLLLSYTILVMLIGVIIFKRRDIQG